MKIKDVFEKLKNILKTKAAVRVISIVLVVLAIGASAIITLHFTRSDDTQTHTVAFDTSGGSSVASLEVLHGERISKPKDPTKSGYVFDGWYVYGIPWNFDMNRVNESIVMRAAWREAVEVTFDTGEEIITVQIAKGGLIRESDLPKTYRDDLFGWFVGGLEWDFNTPVTEPVRLNAGYLSELTADTSLAELSTLCESLGITLNLDDDGDIRVGDVSCTDGAVDLSDYLEYLPHFSAFLKKNKTLFAYLYSDGGLYCAPIPIARGTYSMYINSDWVKILLDGDGFENPDAALITNMYCAPHVTDENVRVSVVVDGAISYITKRLDLSGNIVEAMNLYNSLGGLDGESATRYLRKYIDNAYAHTFGSVRSELFIGDGAVYDTDELVALLRVAIVNASALGESEVGGIYVDIEDATAVASLIAELFGVYGISTALEKMTFSETKIIYDGQDDQVKYAVDAFNRMIYEGLVTFNSDALALVRYGASASDDYTKIACAASARTETKNQPAEYVRVENALECNTLFSISLGESVLFSREKLMSALRLIDALYIGY